MIKRTIERIIPESVIEISRGLKNMLAVQEERLDWYLQKYTFPLKYFLKKHLPGLCRPVTSGSESRKYRYTEICRLAARDESIFNTFKSHPEYRKILEHVTEQDGQAYLDIIKEEGGDLLKYLEKFKENDKYGQPVTFTYEIGRFSPTTLRYIKVLSDLKNIFGDLDGMDIIEIGAGYGGQCKIISDVINYKNYSIVELDSVLPLVRKYMNKLNVRNVVYLSPEQIPEDKDYDLVISNYAFSECFKYVQDEYINKVLNRASRGYITYNYDKEEHVSHPALSYNKSQITQILSKSHCLKIFEERPQTGDANFIIVWDDGH